MWVNVYSNFSHNGCQQGKKSKNKQMFNRKVGLLYSKKKEQVEDIFSDVEESQMSLEGSLTWKRLQVHWYEALEKTVLIYSDRQGMCALGPG